MATTLAALKAELEENVPVYNSVPSSDQYERAIKHAAVDLSTLKPLTKRHTISVVSGTATYSLPADFSKVVNLIDLGSDDNVLVSDAGIIPISEDFAEEYVIADLEITFIPTPQYTADRYLWYAAGYVLTGDPGSETYEDMDEATAYLIMLKAQAIALRWQANKAAQQAWQYQQGDERVNKEKLAESLRKQAKEFEDEYDAAVDPTKRPKQLMRRSNRA